MRTKPKLIAVLVVVGSCLPLWAQSLSTSDAACDVTVPDGIVAGSSERQDGSYGNGFCRSARSDCGRMGLLFLGPAEQVS